MSEKQDVNIQMWNVDKAAKRERECAQGPVAAEAAVRQRVHHLYYDLDVNCARTTLLCLGEALGFQIEEQTFAAAVGLHGAGGFRAQCGLVEGALMFLGAYFGARGIGDRERVGMCRRFAEQFTERFGSLRCLELRPGGFNDQDPPHLCEELTVESILFALRFVRSEERRLEIPRGGEGRGSSAGAQTWGRGQEGPEK